MKLNGNDYKIHEIDFNTVADLQSYGINIYDPTVIQTQPLNLVRAFISISAGLSIREAGNILGQHMSNGGDLDDAYAEIGKAIEDSDFLQKMIQQAMEKIKKAKA